MDVKEIEQIIEKTKDEVEQKIDWTNAWGKKYPILLTYQKEVEIEQYATRIRELLDSLQKRYDYNDLDAMLVLKDILYQVWKSKK